MAEFIPPDYSEAKETSMPNNPTLNDEDDDLIHDCPSDDDDFDDDDEEVAERLEEEYQKRQEELNKNIMTTSPFSPPSSPSPFGSGPVNVSPWGSQPASTPSWGSTGWQNTARPGSSWGGGSSSPQTTWGNSTASQQVQIDRSKKVVFCDFFDCIVEAIDAHGRPGYRPRDIYDVMPKFDVWEKLAAFNPETIYILVSDNMLSASANGSNAWQIALNYFSCCVSSFLRMPFGNCKTVRGSLNQSKESMILKVIDSCGIDRNAAVSIGIYSGGPGMSNADRAAAEACGIAYVDLKELLSKMF